MTRSMAALSLAVQVSIILTAQAVKTSLLAMATISHLAAATMTRYWVRPATIRSKVALEMIAWMAARTKTP